MQALAGSVLPYLLLTYVLSGCALFLAAQRFLRLPAAEVPRLFWLSFGAGPVLVSWLLVTAMQLAPGLPQLAYVVAVEAGLVALGLAGWPARSELRPVAAGVCESVRRLRAWSGIERVTAFLLLAMLAGITGFALLLPITENDAIQYALVSRMFYERDTLAFYPVVRPDPATGFYAVSSHPLGFMGLYLWSFMAQGSAGQLGLVKLVSPAFVCFSLLALAALHWRRPRLVTLTASLLLLATPVYFIQASLLSIDSFRIYLLVAAAGWTLETAERGAARPRLKWVAGIFCGLSMFSHSINLVLTIPLLGAAYLVVAGGPVFERLRVASLIGVTAIVVGGERILSNFLQFGMPIYDFLPVYELRFIRHPAHVWGEAGIIDAWDRVVGGVLRGFADPRSYGITYWIAAAGLVAWLLRWPARDWAGPTEKLLLATTACLYVFAAATVAAGSPAFVTNARYLMTVQPFIASLAAAFLVAAYERYRHIA
ncbi:MAG: hypothetical protein IT529_03085 [Burkholderiales bacterium]|nr:hypothetical protein [Burkholderiales bacterium]